MNSSDEVTLVLHTDRNTDADIFVQRGTTLPTTNAYFLKSTNYESDEVTIFKSDADGGGNRIIYYTVGVYGITNNCGFTLTAVSNTFKVINYELGTIVSASLVNTRPLVLRIPSYLESVPLRVFFQSLSSGVKLMLANESESGILDSIPPHNSNQSLVSYLKAQGYPGTYKIEPIDTQVPGSGPQKLLIFYPDDSFGSVTAVVVHPYIPVKYREGMDPFFFKLGKKENLTVSISASIAGELNEMKFQLYGARIKDYDISFDSK